MSNFVGKISKRGHAPKVIENELPPNIEKRLDDFYCKKTGKKLKMIKVLFKDFFGLNE